EALVLLPFRARGHLSALAFDHNANPLLDRPSALPTPYPRRAFTMRITDHKTGLIREPGWLQPPGGGSVQMTTNAVSRQAVVPGRYRPENPQVSMLNGDDVGPARQRLPGAGPVPAEQLDDDPQKQVQQRVAGQLRQSDVEPKFLGCGLADVVSGL